MRLTAAAVAFLLGAGGALGFGLAPGLRIPAAPFYLLLAAGVTALAAGLLSPSRNAGIFLLLIVVLLGAWRGGHAAAVDPAGQWYGAPVSAEAVEVEGALLSDPAVAGETTRLRLEVTVLRREGQRREVRFAVDAYAATLVDLRESDAGPRPLDGFRYGDRYAISGMYEPSVDAGVPVAGRIFSTTAILLGEGEGNPVRRWLASVRQNLASSIERSVSGAGGGLGAALVTGLRTGLDRELVEDFRSAGTSHILAISGLHVGLVGMLAMGAAAAAFGRGRRMYLLAPALMVWGYAALAGFSPSVTRAAIMASAYLAARFMGRQRAILPAVSLAALGMVAVDPSALGSISFQLSFAAIAGIALFAEPLRDLLVRRIGEMTGGGPLSGFAWSSLAGMVAVSLAATAATAPLIALYFGRVPLWGIPATLLSLPLLPFAIGLSGLVGLAGLLLSQAGTALGWPLWVVTGYIAEVSGVFGGIPPGPVEAGRWAGPAAAVYYGGLVVFLLRGQIAAAGKSVRRHSQLALFRAAATGPPAWLAIVAVGLAATCLTLAATSRPPGSLRVTFFETERGHMTLIETPGGNTALIDGGGSPGGAVRALESHMPFWNRSLGMVLLTHPDADHVGGLQAVLERYEVDLLMESSASHDSLTYSGWRKAAGAHPRRVTARAGQVVLLDRGVALHVLMARHEEPNLPLNDTSVVTRLTYGGVSALLPGDISRGSEANLVRSGMDLRSTVLQVPHHGSKTSSSEEFLRVSSPAIAIVQVGNRNPFGHPSAEVMARLYASVPNGQVFVTRESGTVTLESDGERLWVRAGD